MRVRLAMSILVALVIVMSLGAAVAPSAASETAVLSGIVLSDDASPRPVRRATVRLSGAGSVARLVGTDDEGKFRFEGLPAGSFTVSVSKPGYVTTFHGAKRPGRGPGVLVAVADGARVSIALKMPRGAAISGVVTDPLGRPALGIPVHAIGARGETAAARAQTTTDDRGMYRIYGLAPGEYIVSASPRITVPGRGIPPTEIASPTGRPVVYAPVYYPATTDVSASAPVSLKIGEERAGIDIPLRVVPVSRISGSLVDAAGQPVNPASGSLYPRRREQPSAADALLASGALTLPRLIAVDGTFTISGVAPGEYTLVARSGSGQRGQAPSTAPILWSVTDVTVNGTDQTDLVLQLLTGAKLSGSVAFERTTAASPPDPKSIELTLAAAGTPLGTISTPRGIVEADGSFRFASLAPGFYTLRAAVPPGAAAAWTLKSAMLKGRDLSDGRFESRPAGDLDGVLITFTDRPTGVSGRLVDAQGGAVTRYSIVVFSTDQAHWQPESRRVRATPPATDGSFAIAGLLPGEYALAAQEDVDPADLSDPAFLARLLASAYRFTLADGETKRQDLRVGGQ